MPEFTNAFSGLKENRKLTHDELVRAIRFMIAAEYEAIQLYTQLMVYRFCKLGIKLGIKLSSFIPSLQNL